MSEPVIHIFNHHAMATQFQVRLAGDDQTYAAQAAQAAFGVTDQLEAHLSRFRVSSDIARAAHLAPGEKMRLNEPVYACLEIAQRLEFVTRGAFSITPGALKTQPARPLWTLVAREFSLRCDSGRLDFDLGAIGKGFALDRMAEVLREYSSALAPTPWPHSLPSRSSEPPPDACRHPKAISGRCATSVIGMAPCSSSTR